MNCYLATVLLSEAHNVAAEQNTAAATYALVQIIHNNSVRALSACARLGSVFTHFDAASETWARGELRSARLSIDNKERLKPEMRPATKQNSQF